MAEVFEDKPKTGVNIPFDKIIVDTITNIQNEHSFLNSKVGSIINWLSDIVYTFFWMKNYTINQLRQWRASKIKM